MNLTDGLEIEGDFGILAVGCVNDDGKRGGVDFGRSEFEDDLLSVWREKTEISYFTVRRAFK